MPRSNSSCPVVAFYAPLKPPGHANPSGDRRIAKLFMYALSSAGYEVQLASGFRSLDMEGDKKRQLRLQRIGERIAGRLVKKYKALPCPLRPCIWFTYHLYHKAPDFLGPVVSEALQIPYVVAEASYAPKQYKGPWHHGLISNRKSLKKANLVFSINPRDMPCIMELIPDTPVKPLKMFLEPEAFPTLMTSKKSLAHRYSIDPEPCWLICVAMMRPGDKCRSYKILAASLQRLTHYNWRLLIVGDGAARAQVYSFFSGLSGIHYLGKRGPAQIRQLLSASDLLVWPAVNEALGMAILEAQACGTAVLAGREGGIPGIVLENHSAILVEPRNTESFTRALSKLMSDPSKLKAMGRSARSYARNHHSLSIAAATIRDELEKIRQ